MTENTHEMILKRVVTLQSNPLENRIITIDNEAADKGRIHTFDEWTAIQNNKGKAVLSKADVYHAVKRRDKKFIEGIRNDVKENWLLLNPKHVYKDNLLADIIHYAGSRVTNPVICKDLFVPVWNRAPFDDVLETAEGLLYFQVSNGTRDNAKNIKKTYYELSGIPADKTRVWTPDVNSRKQYPERASGFLYNLGVFLVGGNSDLFNLGRSRGVRIGAAGATPKK